MFSGRFMFAYSSTSSCYLVIICFYLFIYLFNFYDTLIKSFLPRFLFIYLSFIFLAQIIV